MVRVTVCLQFLFLVLILKQSDAVSDNCSELQDDIVHIRKELKGLKYLRQVNEERARQCMVSGYFLVHCLHCDKVMSN